MFWNTVFFDKGTFKPDNSRSPAWNRGAYLVEGPGHCGSCHTPRNFAMAQKSDQSLTGANIQEWHAPPLVSGKGSGLDDWSEGDISRYLSSGNGQGAVSAGPMSEAIHNSLQYLSVDDRGAIAIYLKSLRVDGGKVHVTNARPDSDATQRRSGSDANGEGNTMAHKASPGPLPALAKSHQIADAAVPVGNGKDLSAGERLYMDNCMACHLSGQGMANAFPALVGNSTVTDSDPTNLIQVILNGAQSVQTRDDPTVLTMPNFDWRLKDKQLATLASYVRHTFGKMDDTAARVDAQRIGDIRDSVKDDEERQK